MSLLLFAGWTYYPSGGWFDFQGQVADVQEALASLNDDLDDERFEWAHVVDSETFETTEFLTEYDREKKRYVFHDN